MFPGPLSRNSKLFWLIALFVKGMKTFEQTHLSLIYEEILNTKRERKRNPPSQGFVSSGNMIIQS